MTFAIRFSKLEGSIWTLRVDAAQISYWPDFSQAEHR